MAKTPLTILPIPTDADFSGRPVMNTGQVFRPPDVETGAGADTELLAKGLGAINNDLGQQQQQQSKLQDAYASANFITQHSDLMSSLQSETDPTVIQQKAQQGSLALAQQNASTIQDPDAQKFFLAKAAGSIAQSENQINELVRRKTNDMAQANIGQYATTLQNSAGGIASQNGDPSLLASPVAAALNVAQASYNAGQITDVDLDKIKQNLPYATAQTYIQNLKDPKVGMKILDQTLSNYYTKSGSTTSDGSIDLNATAQAAATAHGGDSADIVRTMAAESRFDPTAVNGSSVGIGQFQPATAKSLGIDPTDPHQAIDGIARLNQQNTSALSNSLGRQPTSSEVYLAYNQGAGAASALLSNPDKPTVDVLSSVYASSPDPQKAAMNAVTQNGGTPDMTAAQFSQKQEDRFNNAPTTAPSTVSSPQPAAATGGVQNPSSWIYNSIPADKIPELKQQLQRKIDANDYQTGYSNAVAAYTPAGVMAAVNDPNLSDTARANLETDAQKIIKQNATDPMAMSIQRQETQPIDWSKPDTLPQQLQGRAALAQTNSENWNTDTMPLTNAEADGLSDFISKQPIKSQLPYIGQIANSLSNNPQAYNAIMAQVAPHNPAVSSAGMLSVQSPNAQQPLSESWGKTTTISGPQAAETILNGQKYLTSVKDSTGDMAKSQWQAPPDQQFLDKISNDYGNAFANSPDRLNNAIATAKAYYVGKSINDGDVSGKQSENTDDRMSEALKVAIGNTYTTNSSSAIIPFGMNESQFKDNLSSATNTAIKSLGGVPPKTIDAFSYINTPNPGQYYVYNGSDLYTVNGRPLRVTVGGANASPGQ